MISQILYLIVAISVTEISLEINAEKPSTLDYVSSFLVFISYLLMVYLMKFKILKQRNITSSSNLISMLGNANSILAITSLVCMFIQIVHLNLLNWVREFSFISNIRACYRLSGLCLFFLYQSLHWYSFANLFNRIHNTNFSSIGFLKHNLKIFFPFTIPWIFIVILEELLILKFQILPHWVVSNQWVVVAVLVFGFFLLFPPVILKFWGCKQINDYKIHEVRDFLKGRGFSFKGIYSWPIYEGRLFTAGIIGPLPCFRYILITESLLEVLSTDELRAVMAHELGHAKLKHMWLYLLILLIFVSILWNINDFLIFLLFKAIGIGGEELVEDNMTWLQIVIAGSLIILMLLFLRYIFGYFMRNFERQADLYGASIVGSDPLISALEKIGIYSGNIRNLPSWHHFSIRERIEALRYFDIHPSFKQRHTNKVVISLLSYIAISVLFFLVIDKSELKKLTTMTLYEEIILKELKKNPQEERLLLALAHVKLEMDEIREAKEIYEDVLSKNPDQHVALNNLAWILVTAQEFYDPRRALVLARRAVELEKNPAYLDTLAEVFRAMGDVKEALKYQEEALALTRDEKERKVLKKRYDSLLSKLGE